MQTVFSVCSTGHGEALRDIHERHGVRYEDLADWAGIHGSTVRNWANDGNGGPTWSVIGLWLRRPELSDAAKLRLSRGLFAGTSLRVTDADKPSLDELDADRDGDVDHRDVLIHASRMMKTTAGKVSDLAEAQAQRRLHAEQIEAVRQGLQQVMDTATKLEAALDHLQLERRMLNGSTNGRRVAVVG
jgi:hypothetical protein